MTDFAPRYLSEDEKEFIRDNYGKMSYKEMAEHLYPRKESTIKTWCRKGIANKVDRGKSRFSRKTTAHTCDENFFERETVEAYYWAGFIAADGYILEKKDRTHLLGIMLKYDDRCHIEKFAEMINSNSTIHDSYTILDYGGEDKRFRNSAIHIRNNKLVETLKSKFNITVRKSLTYNPPRIDDDRLKSAFIKGYIDGDGTIAPVKNEKWDGAFSALGTYAMCNFIKDHIENTIGKNLPESSLHKKSKNSTGNTWRICCSNTNAKMFLKIILNSTSLGLERKWKDVDIVCDFYEDPRKIFTKNFIRTVKKLYENEMKQYDIGEKLNIHQAVVSAIILGKIAPMSDELHRAKIHFKVPIMDAEDAA